MNENESLWFVLTAINPDGRIVGEKFSFEVEDKQDILATENALFDHMYKTIEDFQEGEI